MSTPKRLHPYLAARIPLVAKCRCDRPHPAEIGVGPDLREGRLLLGGLCGAGRGDQHLLPVAQT